MYGVSDSRFEYIFMIPLETRKKYLKCKITTLVLQLIDDDFLTKPSS